MPWPDGCPTCGAPWAVQSKTMGAAAGQPHEGRCQNGHWWREDTATAAPTFLLMNDDATVTPLTRCDDCGFLFVDIDRHVADSVTVSAVERPG